MPRWRAPLTIANVRHLAGMLKQGRRPAARVYESIGADFFLSPAPGWLNLGLWDGPGDEDEAEAASRRLVQTVAADLPTDGVILDVGNGLGAQEPVIAETAAPSLLVAMNITESQLRSGRERLAAARALPVVADALRIPLAPGSVDGVISIEAAFHFASRRRFFEEARRVLAPGGKLAMSDISAERTTPRTLPELVAGVSNLRVWGVRRSALDSAREIEGLLGRAGFEHVDIRSVGSRVLPPAIRFLRARLERSSGAPLIQRTGARILLDQWELLYERGMLDYILVTATAA